MHISHQAIMLNSSSSSSNVRILLLIFPPPRSLGGGKKIKKELSPYIKAGYLQIKIPDHSYTHCKGNVETQFYINQTHGMS